MIDINLKQLEAFVSTADCASFTRAAEELFLTQSTVSSHISALEQQLNVRLIHRGARRRVRLTAEGERAYEMAKDILIRCQALQEFSASGEKSQLTLGASSVPAQYLLPELMSGFLERHGDSRYLLQRGDSEQIHQMLARGEVRLGFVGAALNRDAFYYHTLLGDRLVLIAANNERFRKFKEKGASGRELLSQPMILREETSGTRKAVESYLNRQDISLKNLNIVAQIDNTEAIKSSVSRGIGVSVVSELTVREDVASGKLLAFDLDAGGVYRNIYLTWRKDTVLTPAEQHFVDFVLEERNR